MAETPSHRQSLEEPDELQRDQWESTELSELAHVRQNYTTALSSHALGPGSAASTGFFGRLTYNVSNFWRHQISVTVDHVACRDHLAVERTFLAFLRTSLALSMLGVSVAQLFRLQHSHTPNPLIGFFVLGKPLACICQVAAITTLLIGIFRSWRHQNAIVRGKALSGGFEVIIIGAGFFLIFLTFLVLLIAVDILKEDLKSDK
ncbi:0a81d20a-5499-448b-8c81-aad09bc4273b [Sclerotinia trifoliorum]|uniref:0a81d20a-5499-448b-8c81-aad09bc4273b n=1 Tax=Sclerotinia trifoliorum TaxID=28548 RepID=A0A8H2ZLE3_9HELO|nr:0a81d20a-5499-448b-8c81-aad09bc4273b [Sclerotinia trifoliorum]